jgi:hypothetical protein
MAIRVALAAVLLIGAFVAGWTTNAWRVKAAHEQELRAMLDAGAKVVRQREAVIATVNERLAEVEAARAKVKIIYREAVRNSPDCKAWSEQAIRCPLSSP